MSTITRRLVIALIAVGVVGAGLVLWSLSNEGEAADYRSVESVVNEINASGIECSDMARQETEFPEIHDFGLCYMNGGQYEIDIYIFTSVEARANWLQSLHELDVSGIVVGPRWLLTAGTESNARAIQRAIGGRIAD